MDGLFHALSHPERRVDLVVGGVALAIILALFIVVMRVPLLATPPVFIIGGLTVLCAGQSALLWSLHRILRRRYLCGGPPSIGGVWICPLLATGRTRADQQRGETQPITVQGVVTPLEIQRGRVLSGSPSVPLVEGASLRILVIEDDAVSRHVMSRTLTHAGYAVQQTADGAEGLYLLGSEHPDVVVLDLHLPTVSGQEIARVKADIERVRAKRARVVVVTVDAEAASQAQQLGADAFLVKPVSGEQLVHTVQAVSTQTSNPRVPERTESEETHEQDNTTSS